MTATHHGRPGGRIGEVLAALFMIGVSVCIFVGAICAGLMAWFWLIRIVPEWLVILVIVFGASVTAAPIFRFAWWLLTAIWRPFLRYYKYQAHSLRPIDDEDTNT